MTVRQQWLFVGGIVGVLAVALSAGMWLMRDQLFPVEVGSRAPDFVAREVNGANGVKTLADYKDKVVVLNIWATWCGPCVEEMPTFERLKALVPDTNLRIVAVSTDDYVGMDSVRAFGKNLNLSFELLLDSLHRIDRDYLTTGYPETFVIARDGTIRKKWIGPADWASPANLALIRELLGTGGVQTPRGADTGLTVPLKRP